MALKAEDVQQWNNVVRALLPTVALGVDAVTGIVKGIMGLVRRTEGRPEVQPGDEVLIPAVVAAAMTSAQAPFQQVVKNADRELDQ